MNQFQALNELIRIKQGRVVDLHRHHFKQTSHVSGDEAVHVEAGGGFPPRIQSQVVSTVQLKRLLGGQSA